MFRIRNDYMSKLRWFTHINLLINCNYFNSNSWSFARNFVLENMGEIGEAGQKVPNSSDNKEVPRM